MQGFEVLLVALVLLLIPVTVSSLLTVHPRSLSLVALVTMLGAALIIVATLAICAAALIGDPVGAMPASRSDFSFKHLLPALPMTGWVSVAMLSAIFLGAASSLAATLHRRLSLADQIAFIDKQTVADVEVAMLATDELVAAVLPGSRPCVIMSRGAQERLTNGEFEAVVHHERAHVTLGHHHHLLIARAIERALWFMPGVRPAVTSLRMWLELSADVVACEAVGASKVSGAILHTHDSDSRFAERRRQALIDPVIGMPGLTVLWGFVVIVSAAAIALELQWLGAGF